MSVAAICLPNVVFVLPQTTTGRLQRCWDDWIERDATVQTRKLQSEDTAGIAFELLRTRITLRPAHIAVVAIAEPMLEERQTVPGQLLFKPFNPWYPMAPMVGARLDGGEPDTLWLLPRDLCVEDF